MAAFSIVETKPEVTVLIILTRVCSQCVTSIRLLRDPQGDCVQPKTPAGIIKLKLLCSAH